MPTPKQKKNLRRGNVPATPEAAQRARDAKNAQAESLTQFGEQASRDRGRTFLEILLEVAEGLTQRLDGWVQRGGDPPPVLIPLCRTVRQYCENAIRYSQERGDSDLAQADAIIGEGGVLDVALQRFEESEDIAMPALAAPDENDPHEILERLYGALAAAAKQAGIRLKRTGEAATQRTIDTLNEFRLLTDALVELDGNLAVSKDKNLPRVVDELPARMEKIRQLEEHGFVPPLERGQDHSD